MTQLPQRFQAIIDQQAEIYGRKRTIEIRNSLPDTTTIPISNPTHWLKVADVVSVFVDMKGSTQLSASVHERGTAGAYQLFTGTAVQLFHAFDAPYIDVRGDGVFALFNPDQVYRALAAAVTFKTFAEGTFVPTLQEQTGIELGAHIGIDQKTVLVRKIGLKRYGDRTDRQNEVWAGKPVNMSAKLASRSEPGELLVSERYFRHITDPLVRQSCGCVNGQPTDKKSDLWTQVDLAEDERFDFDTAYRLRTWWCETHGEEYCNAILALDSSAKARAS